MNYQKKNLTLESGHNSNLFLFYQSTDGEAKAIAPCTLDKPTQDLMKLIFDTDMFKDALKKFDLDTKKMPLGKLSKTQIARGENKRCFL